MDKLAQLEHDKNEIAGKIRDLTANVSQTDGFDEENTTRFDELTDQYEKVEAEIKKLREDAERFAKAKEIERGTATVDDRNPDPESPITREDEIDAFRAWMLEGADIKGGVDPRYRAAAEKCGLNPAVNKIKLRYAPGPGPRTKEEIEERYQTRAQSTSDTAGGHLINANFIAAYEQSMLAFGGIRPVSTVIRTETGADLPIPTSNDTGNVAVLVSENVAVTEQDVTLAEILMKDYLFSSKMVRVSYSFLNDAFLNVDTWLGGVLGERMARGTHTYFTTGTNSSQPQGYAAGAGDSSVTLASATAVTYSEMVDSLHSLDPAYRTNATWTFHDTWLKYMRKILDGNNLPIWQPGMVGGTPSTILDRPFVVNQDMATATATKVITIGDMSKFWIRDINLGFNLVRLNERYAEYGQVAFLLWSRHDSKVIDAGTDPIKYVTAG